jgi:hypothetical protein
MISCAGTGQDGEIQAGVAWPNPRFTVRYCNANGPCPDPSVDCDGDPTNDVVIDNLTGLIWARVPDNIHRTWSDALNYTNSLKTCGYVNWRMPNINELQSMINDGQPDTASWLDEEPPLPPPYFIGVESYLHWTSTTHRADRTHAMVVDLWDGSIEDYAKADAKGVDLYYTWPVRFPGYQLSVKKIGAGTGTVTSVPSGIDCGSACKAIFSEGATVTLTAQADPGFIFEGWFGACAGTGTCTVTMNADNSVTAGFGTCTYTISPSSFSFSPAGGVINVNVTASGLESCLPPSISSGAEWLNAQLTTFQNNKGTISITATPSNSSNVRIGMVSIGNATFGAKQRGRTCPLPVLTPSSARFNLAGGDGSFTVSFPPTAPTDCGWVAKRSAKKTWILIGPQGGNSIVGAGNGAVSFSVQVNDTGLERDGIISVVLTQNSTLRRAFSIFESH